MALHVESVHPEEPGFRVSVDEVLKIFVADHGVVDLYGWSGTAVKSPSSPAYCGRRPHHVLLRRLVTAQHVGKEGSDVSLELMLRVSEALTVEPVVVHLPGRIFDCGYTSRRTNELTRSNPFSKVSYGVLNEPAVANRSG